MGKKQIMRLGLVILVVGIMALGYGIVWAQEKEEAQKEKITNLIKQLKDKAGYVRANAASALGIIGDKAAVRPLIAALEDIDRRVRRTTAYALGEIGDPSAVKPLIEALKDEYDDVRWSVTEALGKIGDPSAVKLLIETLKEEDFRIRQAAAEVLEKTGKPAVEPLITALKDKDRNVRMGAAQALGEIGDKSAVKPLVEVLKDKEADDWVRLEAAKALGKTGDKAAVEPLLAALKGKGMIVRAVAAVALGDIGDKSALKPLIEALKDKNPFLRAGAAHALGKIGDPSAVQPLSAALKDEDMHVRGATTEALGRIGDKAAVRALSAAKEKSENGNKADEFYKYCLTVEDDLGKIRKNYNQVKDFGRRLLQKKRKVGLSPDEEKQLQSITKQRQKMLSDMFGLRLECITYYQRALRLTPNEITYLNGMGRNFLELAKIWLTIKDSGWSIRDERGNPIDMNTPGHLSGPPYIKEIMDFPTDQYYKFNQYDFFYCCYTVIRKAYELEPANYERRFAMAQVYRYGAQMTRRDGKIKMSNEYFKKAMKYYQLAKEASPDQAVIDEYIKALQGQWRNIEKH